MGTEKKPDAIFSVEEELLEMLLDAAVRTAFTHRGTPDEMYSLGAKEATANIVALLACQVDASSELVSKCMWVASEALSRRMEISPESARPKLSNGLPADNVRTH